MHFDGKVLSESGECKYARQKWAVSISKQPKTYVYILMASTTPGDGLELL